MKVIFMGTPDFSVPVLEALTKHHEVVCVYCQPPRPAGKGMKLRPSPVQIKAESLGIPVRCPKSLKSSEEQQAFADLKADVGVVCAYGLILPQAVLDAPKLGCINVHASLLPRWRGAAPIQRAIEAGDAQTGITIMQVVEALDAGAMYKKGVIDITPDMTVGVLHDQMAALGAKLIVEVLDNLDNIVPEPQDESLVTYAAKIDKEECRLDFKAPAAELERKIRAFNPYPATYFEYGSERFKLLRCRVVPNQWALAPGALHQEGERLFVGCTADALEVLEIQRQGKKVMKAAELLRGFKKFV